MVSTDDPPAEHPAPRAPIDRRRFWLVLGGIVVLALAGRVTYVATVAVHDHGFYDAAYYELQAVANADGDWYRNPSPFGTAGPAADHPPLTALVLTPVAFLLPPDVDGLTAMRYAMAVLGAGVVLVIGLLGREVAGARVGWIAAGLAAAYPLLWVNDGLVMAETLAAGLTAAAILLAYRYRRRPALPVAAALGAVCALAALARAELILLLPLLGLLVPLLVDRPWRARLGAAGVVLGVAVLVMGPWVAWNLSRFEDPTLLSTNDGLTMRGAACDSVFSGPGIGTWSLGCTLPIRPGDPSVQSSRYRSEALHFTRDHLDQYPAVLAARFGRMWSLYRPFEAVTAAQREGRPSWVSTLGLAFYYPVLLLAVAGAVLLHRRGVAWWPLGVPVLIVVLEVIPAYGWPRLRVPAEPALVVLASVAIGVAAERRRRRRSGGEAASRREVA